MLVDKNLNGEWFFTAGEHEGRPVHEVWKTHPEYIRQCFDNQYGLTEEAWEYLAGLIVVEGLTKKT